MKIAILGAGAFGQALNKILLENGHETKFYDPVKYPATSLDSAISGADTVLYVAPSSQHQKLLPALSPDVPLICASKGFLSLAPFAKFTNFSALGGAAFADHINSKKPVTLTASNQISEQLFTTEHLKVEYTKDTLGILLCGALKNIYAIGAGLYGNELDNATAENKPSKATENTETDYSSTHLLPYLTSVIAEMQSIFKANHAEINTLKLSCGAPDLLLSCSPDSRNFRFGRTIKQSVPAENTTIEGLLVITSLAEYPDFIIPDDATILKDIIATVQAYQTKSEVN